MSDMLIPLVVMLIIIILMWTIDSIYIYALLALIITDITLDVLNSENNFFTVPTQMHNTLSILWIFITLTSWAKTFRMAKQTKQRYDKSLNAEE